MNQLESLKKIIELKEEYKDLEIKFFVDSEVVSDSDIYAQWECFICKPRVDYYYCNGGNYYTDRDLIMEQLLHEFGEENLNEKFNELARKIIAVDFIDTKEEYI